MGHSGLAYPLCVLLKNSATKHRRVTRITANVLVGVHTDLVMARRSFGVVLIVALLSWTVNQLTMECESQHSRAAVVVLAGASPAYQPEPSPTRHNCCPRESQPAPVPSHAQVPCHHHSSPIPSCCSISHETAAGLPPLLQNSSHAVYVASSSFSPALLAERGYVVGLASTDSPGTLDSSFTVLRL
jgi:hypothetical protein